MQTTDQRPGFHGPARLDEWLFNTYDGPGPGTPMVMDTRGSYVPAESAYSAGPGAFVAPAILERGYNAWFGAPGYYVDLPGVDRVMDDVYIPNMYPPAIYANPWDYLFGIVGSYGLDTGLGSRDFGDQAGRYSLS